MYDRVNFSGNLEFMSLPDVFQVFGGNSSTGELRIKNECSRDQGVIYFMDGHPVDAVNGRLRGIEAIYSLFAWSDGRFDFHEKKIKRNRVIKSNRMEIVMDAMRMLDDGRLKKIGHSSRGKPRPYEKGAIPIMKGPKVDYSYVIQENNYRDGESIVNEGSHGNWIWVILDGTVEIARDITDGPISIVRLGKGCFIGTFTSFLFTDYPRSATAKAIGEVQLGLLDILRLSGEYTSLSTDFRNLLISIAGRLKKITDKMVNSCQARNKENALLKNRYRIEEKDMPMTDLYTIREGQISVMGRTSGGGTHLLDLYKGDMVGNVPFMDLGHEPKGASLMASNNLIAHKLDIKMLQREYKNLSDTFKNIIENAGTSISLTTRMLYDLKNSKQYFGINKPH